MNDPHPSDAIRKAQLEARLREEALARAQARLAAEAGEVARQPERPVENVVQMAPRNHPSTTPQAAPAVQSPASRQSAPTGNVHPINSAQTAHHANLEQGGLDFIGGQRDVSDFLRANRHSGAVRVLRIALPLAGVFILSVVFGAYWWSLPSTPSVSIGAANIDNGKMVMKNPELNGVDDKQRPYSLVAKEAIQDPTEPNAVELSFIDAKVPLEEGVFAKILAGKGFYDSKAKTLKLDQDVDIKTDDGMSMTLKDADVDMDAGNLQTKNPVSILTEQAKISADSFTVENNGEKVVFEKRVRMTIYPDKIQEAQERATSQTSKQTQ